MAETKKTVFEILNATNVNEHTETKDTGGTKLTYLSWPWAWAEVKKQFPDATYEIIKFDGIPYVYDPLTGYMVYTTVTINGITHEMWLPVMDGNNKAMKAEPYQVQTKSKTITVNPATMFDINKAIMRCLTKNLAMFGLGLYIYAGEDLPENEPEKCSEPKKAAGKEKSNTTQTNAAQTQTEPQKSPARQRLSDYCKENNITKEEKAKIIKECGLNEDSSELDFERAYLSAVSLVLEKQNNNTAEASGQLPFEV